MKRNLMLQLVLAAFAPMMAVGGSGGYRDRDKPEPIRLVVTNNGKRKLSVTGTKDDEPISGNGSADVELEDAGAFAVSFDDSDDEKKADAMRDSEDRKLKLEIANKSAVPLTLRADGTAHTIEPTKALSLTVTDLDSLELVDSSAVATESVEGQAGSTDTDGAAERKNSVREGPEGKSAPEGGDVKGGYHDSAGKGPGAPDYPGQPGTPGTAPGA